MDANEFLQHDICLRVSVWPQRAGGLFETAQETLLVAGTIG
jgi:hypothetical protein